MLELEHHDRCYMPIENNANKHREMKQHM